jgi:hypothetical protein
MLVRHQGSASSTASISRCFVSAFFATLDDARMFEDPLGQIFASKCGSYINQHQRSYLQSDCTEICNIFSTDSDRLANLLTQLLWRRPRGKVDHWFETAL